MMISICANVDKQKIIRFREGFTPTTLAHPDTYINKVVVGSEEGVLQLWNVGSGQLIYEFKSWWEHWANGWIRCPQQSNSLTFIICMELNVLSSGHRKSSINCIEPSPALDVVGIGLGDGWVNIIDLVWHLKDAELPRKWNGHVWTVCVPDKGDNLIMHGILQTSCHPQLEVWWGSGYFQECIWSRHALVQETERSTPRCLLCSGI